MLSHEGAVNQFFKVSVIPPAKAGKGMTMELHGVGHMYMVDVPVKTMDSEIPFSNKRIRRC